MNHSLNYSIDLYEKPNPESIAFFPKILELTESLLGEEFTLRLQRELSYRHNSTLIIAYQEDKFLGYKMGYENYTNTYYGWVTAVSPDCRKMGVWTAMTDRQHEWCRAHGYKKIQINTTNTWKDALARTVKYGYFIYGTYKNDKDEVRILMEKHLDETV